MSTFHKHDIFLVIDFHITLHYVFNIYGHQNLIYKNTKFKLSLLKI